MKTKHLLTAGGAALCVFTLLPTCVQANGINYQVTDLGTLPSGTMSQAYGINASGQVTGWSYVAGGNTRHAVRWTGTTPENLGIGGAFGINDSGQVAGYTNSGIAVRWTGLTPTNLGSPYSQFGDSGTIGYGINASGQVAGFSTIPNFFGRAAIRWTGTTPEEIGVFSGPYRQGIGINASGQVAAYGDNFGHPIAMRVGPAGTGSTVLDNLPGYNSSDAFGINASGQVAGSSFVTLPGPTDQPQHAIRWTGTTPTDLGFGKAYGINDSGDVTGMGPDGAFLYTGGIMYELNDLISPGSGVTDIDIGPFGNSINNLGQIAASGTIGGTTHALRLDPVPTPEPAERRAAARRRGPARPAAAAVAGERLTVANCEILAESAEAFGTPLIV